ncbi:hypothetical protein PG993_010795 [Apiospora rasikravindrae]|uniref:Uncharacterized protein n=1 Tax=Apiospora rasikravindrae TaxID=990691 RepID=A0ABR1SE49_9PEZI
MRRGGPWLSQFNERVITTPQPTSAHSGRLLHRGLDQGVLWLDDIASRPHEIGPVLPLSRPHRIEYHYAHHCCRVFACGCQKQCVLTGLQTKFVITWMTRDLPVAPLLPMYRRCCWSSTSSRTPHSSRKAAVDWTLVSVHYYATATATSVYEIEAQSVDPWAEPGPHLRSGHGTNSRTRSHPSMSMPPAPEYQLPAFAVPAADACDSADVLAAFVVPVYRQHVEACLLAVESKCTIWAGMGRLPVCGCGKVAGHLPREGSAEAGPRRRAGLMLGALELQEHLRELLPLLVHYSENQRPQQPRPVRDPSKTGRWQLASPVARSAELLPTSVWRRPIRQTSLLLPRQKGVHHANFNSLSEIPDGAQNIPLVSQGRNALRAAVGGRHISIFAASN